MSSDHELPKKDTTDLDQKSIDLLEKSIQDDSPEFYQEIATISEIGNENLNIELVDLDQILEQQKANSFKARFKRFTVYIRNYAVHLFYFVKAQSVIFIKEILPILIKKSITFARHALVVSVEKIKSLKSLSRWQWAAGVVLFFGLVGLAFVGKKLMTEGHLIPDQEKLFIYSMEELSEKKVIYDLEAVEDFYNSARVNQNLISTRRLVVNLRKSKNSGPLPMLAVEFFVQGNSTEVMVEVKDRESEISDLLMTSIKEFTFDELETVEGKRELTEKLTRRLNEVLIKGKVTNLFYKNFVIKR